MSALVVAAIVLSCLLIVWIAKIIWDWFFEPSRDYATQQVKPRYFFQNIVNFREIVGILKAKGVTFSALFNLLTICFMALTIFVSIYCTQNQISVMQKQIKFMENAENERRKELLEALTMEVDQNMRLAERLMIELQNYIGAQYPTIDYSFSVDILNANLASNTIREPGLFYGAMEYKNLFITANNNLELIRSGLGAKENITKKDLLDRCSEKYLIGSKCDRAVKEKLDKALQSLPEQVPLNTAYIFRILYAIEGNMCNLEKWLTEIQEHNGKI